MLTKEQLTALASATTPPAVSIYIPGHRETRDVREGAVRLKNALAAASEQLLGQGHRRPDVAALLQPAQELYEDAGFWRHERDHLALFVAPGLFQVHKLPAEPPEIEIRPARVNPRATSPRATSTKSVKALVRCCSLPALYQARPRSSPPRICAMA